MDSSAFTVEKYQTDDIRAIDARFEAQKIAFAPLTFQAMRAALELGVLQQIETAGDDGISAHELAQRLSLSEYAVRLLCEISLAMNVVKLKADPHEELFVLGKVGFFLLNDELTRVNFNFSADVCYQGAAKLKDSLQSGKPEGLKAFGENWHTVYEALSSLPDRQKQSWFAFDHFYSDVAFPQALPLVFDGTPVSLLVDIGGNTAKWALACCRYNPSVKVVIVDLPGQTAVAAKNAQDAGFADRISTLSANVLDDETRLPEGASVFWMSQFLDCFSLDQVTRIMRKVYQASGDDTRVFVLEPLWDKQRFEGNAYSVIATSLYFACIANGCSKMYRFDELRKAIESSGLHLVRANHGLGSNAYSLLEFCK